MASRYGIETDNWRYADNSPVTSGRGRQANMLNAGLAAYQAVRGFQGDQADSEAADAAKAAQQEQYRSTDTTPIARENYTQDIDEASGAGLGYRLKPEAAAAVESYGRGEDFVPNGGVVDPTYKQQYGLGASPTTFRDTQYTPAEKRTAGLQARVNYWTGSDTVGAEGKAEKAQDRLDLADDRAEARIDRGLTRDSLRRQGILTDQQVAAGARTAAARGRVDAVQDRFSKNPNEFGTMAFNNDISVDGEKHAGKKVQSMALPDGSGYLVWGVDADGKPITKSDGTSHSRVMTPQEMRDQGQLALLGQLAIADPENYLGKAIEAGLSKKKLDITAQHYREEAEKSFRADGLMGKRLDAEMRKIDVQLAHYSQLAKAQQPLLDRAAAQLAREGKFDTERDDLIARNKLDPKDPNYLTRDQVYTELDWIGKKYGSGGGLGKVAPEDSMRAAMIKGLEGAVKAGTKTPQEAQADLAAFDRTNNARTSPSLYPEDNKNPKPVVPTAPTAPTAPPVVNPTVPQGRVGNEVGAVGPGELSTLAGAPAGIIESVRRSNNAAGVDDMISLYNLGKTDANQRKFLRDNGVRIPSEESINQSRPQGIPTRSAGFPLR